jgi:hypothetical protein
MTFCLQLSRYQFKLSGARLRLLVYHKACDLNGEFSWAYSSLGDCLMSLQRWAGAVEVYQQTITLDSKFYWSYYHLGGTELS